MEDKKLIADILKEGLEPVEVNSDIDILNERLRNSLRGLLLETKSKKKKKQLKRKRDKKKKKDKRKFNKWYVDVQQALDKEKNPNAIKLLKRIEELLEKGNEAFAETLMKRYKKRYASENFGKIARFLLD